MRFNKVFMILLTGLLLSQTTLWAKGKDKKKDAEKSKAEVVETMTSEDKTNNYNLPQIPDTKSIIQQAKPPVPLATPVIPKPLSIPRMDPQVVKIQKEIQGILKLNEELKDRYRSQVKEIQRINEQAKIHQKILDDISKIPRKPVVLKPQDTEELLKQEKLRMIEQETVANRKFIEGLKKGEKKEGESKEKSAAKDSKNS